ncbi:MAG: hypothetical protein JWO89_3131 [Verrucomicrobiaceae bacterium]|nr:hypothetical protein [Verrucomicrobiaceae bacterium]
MNHLVSIFCLILSLLPLTGRSLGIKVNEFYNGTSAVSPGTKMASDEYIEFVIVDKTTAAELAALTFGDTNDTTSKLSGVFQFDQATLEAALAGSGLDAFQAGTIIVVKGAGLGAQNLSYNPLADNLSNSDAWSIELVAGQGAKDSAETKINGTINVGTGGDVVWISSSSPPKNNTDTSGFIHAIGYDIAPGKIAKDVIADFGSENILTSNLATGQVLSNVGSSTESLAMNANGTMGTGNGGLNDTWLIGGLRTSAALSLAPEPGRVALLALGSLVLLRRRKRSTLGGIHA